MDVDIAGDDYPLEVEPPAPIAYPLVPAAAAVGVAGGDVHIADGGESDGEAEWPE